MRQLSKWATLAALVGVPIASTTVACGPDSALVGGECATGYAECNHRCVDLQTDPENCGACGHACAQGFACAAGACSGAVTPGDATTDAGGEPPADSSDAQSNDAGDVAVADVGADSTPQPDAAGDAAGDSASSSDAADASDAAACAPPFDTVDHCGDCATRCVAPNDTCKSTDSGYVCAPLCAPPLTNCGGQCVDNSSDPENCGACGTFCSSHLCTAGVCQGSTPGDVVVIGHDYASTPPNTSQARVLANAAFIPGSNPLRVMSYERYADTVAVAHVKAILSARATQLGRALAYTATSVDNDVATGLSTASYDVLLVPDQAKAPSGTLAALGASWATTLTTFTRGGGVAIVLDGDTGTGEMPNFSTSAGLLDVTSHARLSAGSAVVVAAPSDVVGVGVLSPYGVWAHSATFTINAGAGITPVVVGSGGSSPPAVVVHRVVQ